MITEDVPANALGIARARQKNIADYAERREAVTTAAPRTLPHAVSALSPRTSSATSLPLSGYDKRLMLFAGRSNPELAAKIANKLGLGPRRSHAQDVLQRRGLLPLRGVDPRR